MFEKLAEDIAYMAQVKLAALADQIMEKTAKGYGHKLRKHLALTKQLQNMQNLESPEAFEMMKKLQSNAARLDNAAIRGNMRANNTYNVTDPSTNSWFRRNIGKYFGYGPQTNQIQLNNYGQQAQNGKILYNQKYGPDTKAIKPNTLVQNPATGQTQPLAGYSNTADFLRTNQLKATSRSVSPQELKQKLYADPEFQMMDSKSQNEYYTNLVNNNSARKQYFAGSSDTEVPGNVYNLKYTKNDELRSSPIGRGPTDLNKTRQRLQQWSAGIPNYDYMGSKIKLPNGAGSLYDSTHYFRNTK